MDLKLISADVNRLLTNIWAIISFLKEFTVDSAKDVSITFINSDGSESIKTHKNIAKMLSEFESWKSSFTANATFNGSTRGGGYLTKRIGRIRIDSSADYFDTGLIIGRVYVGFSLSANVLYERQDGDGADTSMIGYTTGYIGSERITTSVYGDADIKVKVDADGHILIANTTPPSSDNAYLIYHIEYVTQ